MYPVLFQAWRFPVYSWGVSLAVAFILGTVLALFLAKRKNIHADHVIDLALFICIASIISARLVYVVLNIGTYARDPITILHLRDGGLAFLGGLGGGILVGTWYCRRNKISIGAMADIAAPAVALGYAIVRIGCLLNGCCYGLASSVPWALAGAGGWTLRHPTQIYSSIYGLVILAATLALQNHKKFSGYLLVLFVAMYSVGRFIVEFFRATPRDYFAPFTMTQVICVIMFVSSIWLIKILSSEEAKQVSRSA